MSKAFSTALWVLMPDAVARFNVPYNATFLRYMELYTFLPDEDIAVNNEKSRPFIKKTIFGTSRSMGRFFQEILIVFGFIQSIAGIILLGCCCCIRGKTHRRSGPVDRAYLSGLDVPMAQKY